MRLPIDSMFFASSSLIVLSKRGRMGFWNVFNKSWLIKEIPAFSCHVLAGSRLFLGEKCGKVSFIDVEKFPLRLSDDALLINDFFTCPGHCESHFVLFILYPL